MMRVLLCVTNDLNTDQRMQRICSSLKNNGFEVMLIGRKRKSSLPLADQVFKQKRLNCFFDKGKSFYIEYNLRLFFYLITQKAAILVANDLDTFLPCLLVSKIKRTQIFYDAHELFTETPEVERRPFIKKIWSVVEKRALKSPDLVYTVSNSIAAHFKKKYNREVAIIRNMPLLENHRQAQAQEKIILYQGALNEGRGLENLFLAMQKIDAKLWLAGDGDIKNSLQKLSFELGIQEKTSFLGSFLPHDLKNITTQAYIGINLLEDRSLSYQYSLANKFFDYVMAEIPQICIDFKEYQNLNKEFEVAILSSIGIADIVNNINLLLADEQKYQQLKENCKKAKLQWNWQQEEKKLLTLYHKQCQKP